MSNQPLHDAAARPGALQDAAAANHAQRTAAMAYTSASSATTLPGPATYADPGLGRFGGITLRTLTTGGRTYPAGCLLSPELVMSFRPANRAALQSRGVILLFERELPPEVREKLEARDREIARQ